MTDAFTADKRAATTINGLVRTVSMRTPAASDLDTFTADEQGATTTNPLVMTAMEQITAATVNELDTITANVSVIPTMTIMQLVLAALEDYNDEEEYESII